MNPPPAGMTKTSTCCGMFGFRGLGGVPDVVLAFSSCRGGGGGGASSSSSGGCRGGGGGGDDIERVFVWPQPAV